MLEKLGEGGMRGKLGAKKWQWRLLSLNEETLAWYSEASAGGGADGTAEDAMTEMVRPAPAPAPALPLHVTLRCVALSTINWPIQSVNVNTHAHNKLVRLFCGDANVCAGWEHRHQGHCEGVGISREGEGPRGRALHAD